ncbi:sensor histidine kinase [Litorihabitans aurantiacus]|uniref:sensor histidine kinase n=1 Tax=Litorihabitans aurantiacus TaxID=1930061 RepID=UPI0024E06902|nr:ATP-binding protein [Litorihabitans aurantiacus]
MEDLLADASARHAFADPVIERVSVGRLVRDSVQVLTPRAARAGVDIESAVESGLVIRGDARAVGQVMDNLVSNAVKYSDTGDTVVVVAEREGDDVVVRVADNGIGISPEDQERLFERFFRSESVRGERHGTGLGLHLVREIVLAHGGTIEVDSDLGEGTQITVRMPYAGEHPAPEPETP